MRSRTSLTDPAEVLPSLVMTSVTRVRIRSRNLLETGRECVVFIRVVLIVGGKDVAKLIGGTWEKGAIMSVSAKLFSTIMCERVASDAV